ncbi:MAG: hypothetical protein BWY80_00060 [Firmicutes bacterium ADurb.Bin456]|nr:MAG: hypothetical protein BWY80_00060 [Firmicutes bacterium ADurb.Bin456]
MVLGVDNDLISPCCVRGKAIAVASGITTAGIPGAVRGLVPILVFHAGQAVGLGGEVYGASHCYLGRSGKIYATIDVKHECLDVSEIPIAG